MNILLELANDWIEFAQKYRVIEWSNHQGRFHHSPHATLMGDTFKVYDVSIGMYNGGVAAFGKDAWVEAVNAILKAKYGGNG
jgi:hypothetical protein